MPALQACPQRRGVCTRVYTNAKEAEFGIKKSMSCAIDQRDGSTSYIGGEGHNLQEHSVVLIRGGESKICQVSRYHTVRGALDASGVNNRNQGRSKYGTKKPKS